MFVAKRLLFAVLVIGQLELYAQEISDYIDKALMLVKSKDVDSALRTYDEAIEQYPDSPILHVLKGELIANLTNRLTVNDSIYRRALEEFNRALDLDSTFLPAYSSRGLLNLFYQKYPLAIVDFTTVVSMASENSDQQFNALADRASAKFYCSETQGAIEDYERALKIKPNEIGIKVNLGAVYVSMGEYYKAKDIFLDALRYDPKNLDALNNLAVVHIKLEEPELAISVLEKARGVYPAEPDIYSNLGLATLMIGKPNEALQLVNAALSIYPDDSYAYKHRAMVYIALGRVREACEDLILANKLGYSVSFDDEVNELIKKNCGK